MKHNLVKIPALTLAFALALPGPGLGLGAGPPATKDKQRGAQLQGSLQAERRHRLEQIDEMLRKGAWDKAMAASRQELDKVRGSLAGAEVAAAAARLALAEAGAGKTEEAVWHWHIAQALDRSPFPDGELVAYGPPGELLQQHRLRPAGQAPTGLTVYELTDASAALEPPRSAEGGLPAPSARVQVLSVPKWLRLQLIIDAEGRLREPVILGASSPGLAYDVLDALRDWRFVPAKRGGQPVAVFFDLTLNPPAEKPLAELASLGPDLIAIEGQLRAHQWKDAQKRTKQVWSRALSTGQGHPALALALQAVAEAGEGLQDEAICHWQAAQYLEPLLYHADLSPYGPAGDLLEQHRWGTASADLLEASSGQEPKVTKQRPPRIPAAVHNSIFAGTVVVEGVVDPRGAFRQPVVRFVGTTTNLSIDNVGPTIGSFRFSSLRGPAVSLAASALESVCYWRFEPAAVQGSPVAVPHWLAVSFDRSSHAAGMGGNLPTSKGQTPEKPDTRPDLRPSIPP